MKDTAYAFSVAKIRAAEKDLLSENDIEKLISKKDYDSALAFLSQKKWQINSRDLKEVINEQKLALWNFIKLSVPDNKFIKELLVLNDFFNLKVLVKCHFQNKKPHSYFAYPSNFDFSKISVYSPLNAFSKKRDKYTLLCYKALQEAIKEENRSFSDIIIDRFAIDALYGFSKKQKDKIYRKMMSFYVDCTNIKVAYKCISLTSKEEVIFKAIGNCFNVDRNKLIDCALQGKEQFISFIKEGKYKEVAQILNENHLNFDKWLFEEILKISDESLFTSFGVSPVISYYCKKTYEIKCVKIILQAIELHLPQDYIKERVKKLSN